MLQDKEAYTLYLDYTKLEFDTYGNPEAPELMLKTLSENTIGVIPGVHNLKLNIKFSEPSEISFDVPAVIDGEPNWIYDRLSGHKIIYTKHYGIYMTMNPETESNGISDLKHIRGYSIEKTLDSKRFFLEEGTFKFYDQTNANNRDTIIGRILEIAHGWRIGYISPALAQRYRTFDQYDDHLLSFIYNAAPEQFRGVFVFDPYAKSINAYDADEERSTIPIYLDFDNLIETLGIEELSDELVTAIRPYGADGLDIREVNPIGTNWIYDLSHFIANEDLPQALVAKWDVWQKTMLNHQERYRGLNALSASASARLLAAQAVLENLQGELDSLTEQQSATIQTLAKETTSAGKEAQQEILDQINASIAAKKQEIKEKQETIASIEDDLDESVSGSCAAQIKALVDTLSITKAFTDEEYQLLSHYFIERDVTENTFVATSVDSAVSGTTYTLSNETVTISGSSIAKIDLTSEFGKRMYTLTGGTFAFEGDFALSGDIIRGTMEEMDAGQYVLSIYAGSIKAGEETALSGVIAVSGTLNGLTDDIHAVTVEGMTTYEGTALQFVSTTGSLYLTASINEYQKYSVQMELYDFAVALLADAATPTYEFSVDSGNFIFADEFAPFRNELELGKGVYLNVGGRQTITPYIIEFVLDFEKRNHFSIVFSNRFKRHDNCNTLKYILEKSYSSSRSFDASKYIYNQAANQASSVSKFMNDSFDAAKNTILAAANQSVKIDGAGIHVGGDSKYQMRIVDSMLAMTDDNWEHSKLAIGQFASEDIGSYFGVNAEVIGGKLIVGNNLVIENETDNGVMQFKVDSSGAWLNNSTFLLQKDNGGKLMLDPTYGIAAGTGNLFNTSGTTVTPSFIDSNGKIKLDSDGMPLNTNFYLDPQDGSAYFRGKLAAAEGTFSGELQGATGKFKGAVQASSYLDLSGRPMLTGDYKFTSDYLELKGLNVNDNFIIDSNGNVQMRGDITMTGGNISWPNINESGSTAYKTANSAYSLADDAYDEASKAVTDVRKLANGQYRGTFIDGQTIVSPKILTNMLEITTPSSNDSKSGLLLKGYYGNRLLEMLEISYFEGDSAWVHFKSPASSAASWRFLKTEFYGDIDFSRASVSGINTTATFG